MSPDDGMRKKGFVIYCFELEHVEAPSGEPYAHTFTLWVALWQHSLVHAKGLGYERPTLFFMHATFGH